MKKRVQLSTIIKIKDSLEKLIQNSEEYVLNYNNTEMKVEKSLETIQLAEEALIPIKETIQEANKGKHEDGKTNNYYIYKLSNLNGKKKFLLNVKEKASDKAQLDKSGIDDKIATIDKDINEIRTKLSNFNTKEVSIEVSEDLSKLGLNI